MRLKNIALASGVLALVAAPVALQAQAADRAVAPVSEEAALGGGSDTILAVIAAAVLAGFIILTATDDDAEPLSP